LLSSASDEAGDDRYQIDGIDGLGDMDLESLERETSAESSLSTPT
jgi:hypothetical protein